MEINRNFLILIFVTRSPSRDLINNSLTIGGPKFTRNRRPNLFALVKNVHYNAV